MAALNVVLSVVISYLLGAIPTAYLFGKLLKQIDIREHGSGNVGATNAFRVLGKGPGALCLVLDILKGLVAVTLVADFFGMTHILSRMLLAVIAVCGHNWTVFLQFKGGKGIATTLGVLIGLTIKIPDLQMVLVVVLGIWLAVFLTSGFVSLASIIAAIALPLTMVFMDKPLSLVMLGITFCLFVVIRHQGNIKRLLEGKENRVKLPFHNSSKKK